MRRLKFLTGDDASLSGVDFGFDLLFENSQIARCGDKVLDGATAETTSACVGGDDGVRAVD